MFLREWLEFIYNKIFMKYLESFEILTLSHYGKFTIMYFAAR